MTKKKLSDLDKELISTGELKEKTALNGGEWKEADKSILLAALKKQYANILLKRRNVPVPWQYKAMRFLYHQGGRNALKGKVLPVALTFLFRISGMNYLFAPYKKDPEFNANTKTMELLDFVFMYEAKDGK